MKQEKPEGLYLYNSLTKHEELFVPANPKRVTMYTCGPTVYGRPHIGNYASFLMADLLRRWLEFGHGYIVKYVKNITDVGHLVKDQDEGEDKIEKQAKEESGTVSASSVITIVRKYEKQYLEDEAALNFLDLDDDHRPRATEYIEQMKEMIETLLHKKFAYVTSDGIYFDVTRFPQYGELSGNRIADIESGARVAVNEAKRHPADFALWKFCVGANEHHALRWPSPHDGHSTLPDGFPGWHIECSAMSRALLGDQIDIHTGGEDNIFPHHECEIAQSESVTEANPFVRMWLHKRRIDLEGTKMSKSLGNVLNIPDIVAKGYDPLDIRYYLLSVHYRTNLKFSWKGMDDAKKARRKIVEWMKEMEMCHPESVEGRHNSETMVRRTHHDTSDFEQKFADAMNSDLNTPAALAVVFDAMSDSRHEKKSGMQKFILLARDTFGCFEEMDEKIPADVQTLADARDRARAAKDFAESDRLRAEIESRGFTVKDTKDGQQLRKN